VQNKKDGREVAGVRAPCFFATASVDSPMVYRRFRA